MKTPKEVRFDNFIRLFKKSGYSQQRLIDFLGVKKQYVSALLHRRGSLGDDVVLKLAEFFNVPWTEFYKTEEAEPYPAMPPDLEAIYPDIEYIYLEGNAGIKQALTFNISEFKASVLKDKKAADQDVRLSNLEREFENYRKTHSSGHDSGTSKKPARPTGSKRKAG